VEADISELAPGALQIVEWRGKPVWILRRTAVMLAAIRADDSLVADPRLRGVATAGLRAQ